MQALSGRFAQTQSTIMGRAARFFAFLFVVMMMTGASGVVLADTTTTTPYIPDDCQDSGQTQKGLQQSIQARSQYLIVQADNAYTAFPMRPAVSQCLKQMEKLYKMIRDIQTASAFDPVATALAQAVGAIFDQIEEMIVNAVCSFVSTAVSAIMNAVCIPLPHFKFDMGFGASSDTSTCNGLSASDIIGVMNGAPLSFGTINGVPIGVNMGHSPYSGISGMAPGYSPMSTGPTSGQ